MRTPFLAANWKMNLTRREAKNLVEDLVKQCHPLQDREMGHRTAIPPAWRSCWLAAGQSKLSSGRPKLPLQRFGCLHR
jgi:triosephosphate isomerase